MGRYILLRKRHEFYVLYFDAAASLILSNDRRLHSFSDPNGKRRSKIWEPVSTPDVEYLHIFNGSLVMKKRPMWDDYLFSKQLGHPFLNTLNSFL